MYQVPSEFMRQKATVVWFLTVEHAVAAFAGYLLAEALGGGTLVTAGCVALGLALYRFAPLMVAYLARKLTGDAVEPEDGPAPAPAAGLAIRDAEGRPILYQEK